MLLRCNIYYAWNATLSKCSCPSGWLMSPTLQCYYKSVTAAAWDLAELDCISKNAHLISVNTQAELSYLISIRLSGAAAWVFNYV